MKGVLQSHSDTELVIDRLSELVPDLPEVQRHMLAVLEDQQMHLEKLLRRSRRERLLELRRNHPQDEDDEKYEQDQLLHWLHGGYSVTA